MSSKLQSKAAWEAGPLAFISRQFFETVPPIPKSVDLSGQIAIVTGSNVGLGFECARQLLSLNLSHLIIAVRSRSKGDAAARLLQEKFPTAKIEVSIVDMASYKSIIAFAKRCESLPRLDIAILNAGLSRPRFERADESKHEMTFQVNYLSTALLALLLVPILKSKRGTESPAHLALVGSDASYWADWKDTSCKSVFQIVDNAANFATMDAYKKSKLFLNMFLERLSEQVSADEVIINVPNPGACKGTEFGSDNPSAFQRFMFKFMSSIMARKPEIGARQYVDAATVQGVESHGGFVSEGKVKPFPEIMYESGGRTLQETLWNETMRELEFAGVAKIFNVEPSA
ncbi:Fc.00g083660.m01.CDS01 [Cosmosporella sp. VM-42]